MPGGLVVDEELVAVELPAADEDKPEAALELDDAEPPP